MTAVTEPAVMPAASRPRRGKGKAVAVEGAAPPVSGVVPPAVQHLPIALLDDHPLNPREELTDLDDLAASIREQGLLQDLLVVPSRIVRGDDVDDGRYTVLIGHRRKAAADLAGLTTVPCRIRELADPAAALQVMLVENLQRVDLAPLSEARAYQQLVDTGMSQRDVAQRVGRNQSHISKRLSLLRLPDVARTAVLAGEVSLNEAAAVASVADRPEVFTEAWEHMTSYGWDAKRAVAHAVRLADDAAARAKVLAELEASGARVTSTYLSSYDYGSANGLALNALPAALRKKHSTLPCHVANVDQAGKVTWGCDAPKTHRPKDKGAPAASSEAQERALRKELKTAQAARIEALKPYMAPGLLDIAARDGILALAMQRLLRDDASGNDRARIVLQLLDVTPEKDSYLPDVAREVTGWRAQALALATAVATCEAPLTTSYRAWGPRDEEYLRLVTVVGYELSDVEHQRLGHKRSSVGEWVTAEGGRW